MNLFMIGAFISVFFLANFLCERDEKNILFQILESHPQLFKEVIKNAGKNRLQILYIQIYNLNIAGFNKFTSLKIDSAFSNQSSVRSDSTSEKGLPSIVAKL